MCENDVWTYYHGGHPVYFHRADNTKMFRFITSQLVVTGSCRQVDIIKSFGVSKNSVIRSVNKLRNEGAEAFFKPRKGRRKGTIFTPTVLEKAQSFLDQGLSRQDTAEELGVRVDTLRKAIGDNRLHEPVLYLPSSSDRATSKSSRDRIDADAADFLGTACTRVVERVSAAFGELNGAKAQFEPCLDMSDGVSTRA